LAEAWLELGLQNAHDATLARINRGHTTTCSEKAVTEAAGRGMLVCGHLMAGMPGEGEADFLASVAWAAILPLHGLKLHNVYVPEGTELARQYRAGHYLPLERDEYVDLLCAALPHVPSRMVMHRLQSDPAPGELVAPAWAGRGLWQGYRADTTDRVRRGAVGAALLPNIIIFVTLMMGRLSLPPLSVRRVAANGRRINVSGRLLLLRALTFLPASTIQRHVKL